ncbi:MAG TPA: hypothetical protein ENN33_02520 [Ignavibacteria bacterium]|nr:hypothetical protein [Ignavibacteria bacterium]
MLSQEEINKGRISGYMFGDYFYNITRDNEIESFSNTANGGEKDVNGIQFRRIYFTYDYNISAKFSSRFRLEADQKSTTSNDKIGVYVKDAYLKWTNIFTGSDFIFGIQPTPAFEISEEIWGHRFLERTIMDLRGIVSSRDIAVSLKGKLNSDGTIKYWLMFGNGSGNKPELDKYNRYYAHLQYTPFENFTSTIYVDFKARPKIENPIIPGESISNNDITYALFVGYKKRENFSIGIEGFLHQRQNGMISLNEMKNRNGLGISAFGSYNFNEEFSFAGRYDFFDPNIDKNSAGDLRNWMLISLNYKPDKKVTISPNIIYETYQKSSDGRTFKPSLTLRITFFYIFI